MKLQDYLRSGGTPEALETSRAIGHRRHKIYPNLALFKYSMVDSPMDDPIVRESRGVILDEAKNWEVVSRAFDKFFNHGEGHADEIDWGSARVQEKLDGSLAVLYHYEEAWHVATSGTPDASGDVNGQGTFAEYFWETFKVQGGLLPKVTEGVRDLCFIFELMGPSNRIVVVHEKPWLRLLGVRNRRTGEQFLPDPYKFDVFVNVQPVRSFPLGSYEEIAASFASISPLSQEGYVVVDQAFHRVKVKHPGYVALHHAKDGMGAKAILEIARSGETSEVEIAFPEFATLLNQARARVDALTTKISTAYEQLREIPEQKDFAMEALKTGVSPALFALRKHPNMTARQWVREISIERLADLVGDGT